MLRPLYSTVLVLVLPMVASAQTLSQAAGVFNIFVGLMLATASLMFFGALLGWYARRGVYPSYRDEMIRLMQWAVVILFVLLVMLAAIHFVQTHQETAAFMGGLLVFVFLAWIVVKVASTSSEGKEEHR